jgi:hypothetical protein
MLKRAGAETGDPEGTSIRGPKCARPSHGRRKALPEFTAACLADAALMI